MFLKVCAAALASVFLAAPALAMDCEKEFRVRVDQMAKPEIRIYSKDMVHLTRFALKGYDACMKGDMASARKYFERATRNGS